MDPKQALQERMKAIPDEMMKLASEGGDGWNDKYESLKSELGNLQNQMKALDEVDALRGQAKAFFEEKPRSADKRLPGDPTEATKDDVVKTANINKGAVDTPVFNAVKAIVFNDERAQKDLGLTTSPKGGWILPPQISDRIVERLEADLVFTKLGVTYMPVDNQILEIPVENSDITAYWVGENKTHVASDFTGGSETLSLKYVSAAVAASKQLLNSTASAKVDELITRRITNRIRRAAELAYFTGIGAVPSGSSNTGSQPRGLVNIPNVYSMGVGSSITVANSSATFSGAAANGGLPTLTDFSRLMQAVEVSDVPDNGTKAWVMHPRQLGVLREMADEMGRQYFVDNVSSSRERPMLYGYPIHTTTQIPTNLTVGSSADCSYIFFGEWENFVIGQGPNLELESSEHAQFMKRQVVVLGTMGTDCQVMYPQAFAVMTGVRMSN